MTRWRIAVSTTILGALLALGGAVAPATAATSAIELSRDGVSWAPALTGSLFGTYRLLPQDSATRSFYVRNNAPSAGYLRITLRDVTTDNLDYADALSLRADLFGWPGETTAVGAARPCARLSEGPIIASGAAARVDLTAILGDLDGQLGQGGSVGFQLVISLSGQPQGLGATGCPTSGVDVVGATLAGTSAPRTVIGGAAPRYISGATGWIPSTSTPVVSDPTTTGTGTRIGNTGSDDLRAVSNTDRFYQEYDVALWLLAALLGAAAIGLVRRPHRAVRDGGTDTSTGNTDSRNGALR